MNIKSTITIFLITFSLTGCALFKTQTLSALDDRDKVTSCEKLDKSDLPYDSRIAIYTSDCKGYQVDEIQHVLNMAFSDDRAVVLFVHGRGDEPKKSLKGGFVVTGLAVHKLESQYNAKVLMFSWDSKRGGWGPFGIADRERPLENTPDAAKKLNDLIARIKQYCSEKRCDKPITLMAHSMGNIVLQKIVENKNLNAWPNSDGSIFSNVVLSSSDADNLGHEKWVENIASIERTYVVFNKGDGTLEKSKESRQEGAVALGLDPGDKYAASAKYIDLTGLGISISDQNEEENDHHEMFNKCSMYNQVNMCRFYDSAIEGKKPILDSKNAVKDGQIYKLKSEINKKDSCFNNKCDYKKPQ